MPLWHPAQVVGATYSDGFFPAPAGCCVCALVNGAAAEETVRAAADAVALAAEGAGSAVQASAAMQTVRSSSEAVSDVIRGLHTKSDEIGGIVSLLTMVGGRVVYADGPFAIYEDRPPFR